MGNRLLDGQRKSIAFVERVKARLLSEYNTGLSSRQARTIVSVVAEELDEIWGRLEILDDQLREHVFGGKDG